MSNKLKPLGNQEIKAYDFRLPDKFTKEQLRAISVMYETFARLTATSLSAQLRAMVNVNVASVSQFTYEEFVRSTPTPTTFAIISMDPLRGNAILEIEPAITFSMIDRLAGGTGEGAGFQHELTDIETSLMEGIIVCVLGNMREAWLPVIDLCPRLGQIDTNPQFAQITPPTDMVILIALEVKIGDTEGCINICLPFLTIEPIISKLSFQLWFSSERYAMNSESIFILREKLTILHAAEILRRKYSIREISGWKEGTILYPARPLPPDICFLTNGKRQMWQCEILNGTGFRQIKIAGPVKKTNRMEDAEMETRNMTGLLEAGITITVEIGATMLNVREAMSIGEGTILELDKLVGEPVSVKANNVLFGKGEVVVIDENFGVRITEIIMDDVEPELDEETEELEGN